MARCIVIAPLYGGEVPELVTPRDGDLLLCADGGYARAAACGLTPDMAIGDFDTMPAEMVRDVPLQQLPVEKDDTDLAACIHEGRRRGYRSFLLCGCLGGRVDHTMAALQCMAEGACRGEEHWAVDAMNRVTILTPGEHRLPKIDGMLLSLLAFGGDVRGVTLQGTKWPLKDAVLTATYPLGVSNVITAEAAQLRFTEGQLMVCYARNITSAGKE